MQLRCLGEWKGKCIGLADSGSPWRQRDDAGRSSSTAFGLVPPPEKEVPRNMLCYAVDRMKNC